MIGIILAGGNGTRLKPLTEIVNKHLLPVYKKPMIEYPLETLKLMGCDNIIIVSGGNNIGGFAEYLGDGSRYEVELTYKVQTDAGGVAQALSCAENLAKGLFPVILGDNYFSEAPVMPESPTIYYKKIEHPNRFGVFVGDKIIEKPKANVGNKAVTGLYVYDEQCFEFINKLKPSDRGELEITDVNNAYLKNGMLEVEQYFGHWSDMGTFESLLDTSYYVWSKENEFINEQ